MNSERENSLGLTKLRQTYERKIDAAVRNTGSGWRFYDNQGRSFALGQAEGAALHAAGRDRVDRLIGSLDGESWLSLIPTVLAIVLGMRMAAEFVAFGAMPTAFFFVPCVLFCFKSVIAEIRFAFAFMAWREEQAQVLRRRDGREHERHGYAAIFDPRLPQWAGRALMVLVLTCLLIISGAPPLATALVVAGLGLIGAALLGAAVKSTDD